MNGHDTIGQENLSISGTAKEAIVYDELTRGFGNFYHPDLDETAFEVLDRILDFDENDSFYCEATCLSYAAHVLALENGPKEVWVILDNDGSYAFPHGEDEQYVEEMTEKGNAVMQAIGEDYPRFKGFANTPPDGPYKTLITVEPAAGVPDALCWAGMSSYFYDQLDVNTSRCAIIYPSLDKQPKTQSLREGLLVGKAYSWAAELPNGQIIIGLGGGNGFCHMVDLSNPEHPWEYEASPFVMAACGGCLVPSMCRKCADVVAETSLAELATRISRGTSLSRKALDPYPYKTVESTLVPIFSADSADNSELPEKRRHTYRKSGSRAEEGDFLFLDSSCINSDKVEPMFIDEIPKGQERYTVKPEDGEVLLISRNEKSFVFYKATAPTLIANSVYVAWLNPDVDTRYLECWIEGSYAERWLKTAGKIFVDPRDPEPILSKGTLSSLPVPVFNQEIAGQTLARKNAILHEIQKLYYEIGKLESMEAFAPASAMANPIEEADARRIEQELSEPVFLWQA